MALDSHKALFQSWGVQADLRLHRRSHHRTGQSVIRSQLGRRGEARQLIGLHPL